MENSDNSLNTFLHNKTLRIAAIVITILLLLAFVVRITGLEEEAPQPSETEEPKETIVPKVPTKSSYVEGQIIVKFKEGTSDAVINQRLKPFDAKIKEKIEGINSTIVSVPPGQEERVREAIAKDPLVQYAEPDYIQTVQFVPNDTYFKNQWGLANAGLIIGGKAGTATNDINIESAWDVTKGNGVKVAVIDTGIDMNHPDLSGKVVAQKVFTTTSIDDKFGHGTHVAGVIAANTNNSQGIAGVCPDCKLLVAKAMNDSGLGSNSVLAQAIIWATDNGAKVINMSEGGSENAQVQAEAVGYAWEKGSIVIAAAGNNNSNAQFYPAALPNVVSVASSDNLDKKSSFSNYGTWVNLAAPGTAIFSTMPTKAYVMQEQDNLALNYDYLSGTSMATPVVSGVAGLVWASSFGTTNQSVVDRLLKTTDKIAGTGQYWENGRINAAAAVGPAPTVAPTAAPTAAPTTAPTAVVPTTTGATPTPTIILTPTLYCLGSCPTLPVTETPLPTAGGTILPTTSSAPGGATTAPTTATSQGPTIDPCASTENVEVSHSKHKKHHGQISKGMTWFLEFLIELIRLILELIGGRVPGSPSPTPDPCAPTAMPTEEPTAIPSETEPTTAEEPTVAPTTGQVTVVPTTGTAPTTAPGTNPSGEAMPGEVSGWKLIFADDFNGTVPVGAFSDCDNNTDTPQATCNGLQAYPEYYENWWAYPNTWSDTAKSGADGNTGAPFGGVYHPEDTVFVDNGAMHVKMFRPAAGGDNHVGTVVPRKCMDHQYGRYVERFKVVQADPGFKSAHLFYGGGFEIDYPENDYGGTISGYTHPGGGNVSSDAKWTEWHTTAIEWTAGKVTFFMDGREIGTSTNQIPNIPLSWVLQNESSILGPYAEPGATAQLDIDWVACYSPA